MDTTTTPDEALATVTPMQRLARTLPITVGLLLVAGVWFAGAVWSFSEQRDFAAAKHFDIPILLPLTFDGLALSLAVVAWSAALDGRAAGLARIGTFGAITASATSNATWAASRTGGDVVTVVLAAGVPLASAIAFETLLAELRKGVHRRRGEEPPVVVTAPRLIRLALAPASTFRAWRKHVLDITSPARPARARPASRAETVPSSSDGGDAKSGGQGGGRSKGPNRQRPHVDAGDLLLAAQAVQAEFARNGSRLSRRTLIDGLRARGHGCGTEKAKELLRQLNAA
ncbi:DUF2637 domain-containing protein [Spongisporangium articulatum]|uniref:DUF2637 domain-containing protein n=1 Tax=Spongisporangium articulatum TaxID=3362603 RepID=A0ABW8ANE0_9ACTN